MTRGAEADLSAPPAAAVSVFGERLPVAVRYAALLATAGVERGLIGPREVTRLWERHLLNCAVVSELLSPGDSVVDIGTGAGLPGMVLAVRDPALPVILVEPLARRVTFLDEAVAALDLSNVTVRRARAEELRGKLSAPVVTARAVAPLDRLARWALPLLWPGGRLLAIKGRSAQDEIALHAASVRRAGGEVVHVAQCGAGVVDPPATVIVVERRTGDRSAEGRKAGRSAIGRGRR